VKKRVITAEVTIIADAKYDVDSIVRAFDRHADKFGQPVIVDYESVEHYETVVCDYCEGDRDVNQREHEDVCKDCDMY
jgi:hypothetical protein